jgi:hypothetical protein
VRVVLRAKRHGDPVLARPARPTDPVRVI